MGTVTLGKHCSVSSTRWLCAATWWLTHCLADIMTVCLYVDRQGVGVHLYVCACGLHGVCLRSGGFWLSSLAEMWVCQWQRWGVLNLLHCNTHPGSCCVTKWMHPQTSRNLHGWPCLACAVVSADK